MIFIGNKESFIARVLIKKVQDAGINCSFVPCTVDDINSAMGETKLVTFYIEDGAEPHTDVLHFLADTLDEKNSQMILIGGQDEIRYVYDNISSDLVYASFSRPVDNTEYTEKVTGYFDRLDSGDFKKSILIVDDDPQYLATVRSWLRDEYKVTVVNSGLQAIKFLGKNRVDLILLDHEMPVTSGPQVLEMLRSDEETRSIPVMFLTGKGDKKSVMEVVALKPEGYFLKSILRDELLEKLKEFFIMHNTNSMR